MELPQTESAFAATASPHPMSRSSILATKNDKRFFRYSMAIAKHTAHNRQNKAEYGSTYSFRGKGPSRKTNVVY